MALVFTVQADSPEECAAQLSRLCAVLGLSPSLRPTCSTGTGRWIARAVPKAKAPAEEGRG
ncbi:hypothetical protein [Streptomyces sp900116325]|uniref:hypothetical protein n=1 Tax=Streptomyces sp. 900116325 TaxID=3154295 RepID=UPI003320AE5C